MFHRIYKARARWRYGCHERYERVRRGARTLNGFFTGVDTADKDPAQHHDRVGGGNGFARAVHDATAHHLHTAVCRPPPKTKQNKTDGQTQKKGGRRNENQEAGASEQFSN